MRRRVIRTTKLLVIAAGTAACAATPQAAPVENPTAVATVTADAAPQSPPTGEAVAATASAVADPPPAQTVEPSPEALKAKLHALRGTLSTIDRSNAMQQVAKFEPLCDKDGYPLVGNLVRKGEDSYHPSEFCKDLRAKR